ncbi:MAG: hypothetical protein IPM29_04525 [Planctomycetes bacterium]|nr:hypothetical protein [Planctomycetota bacterium]
MTTPQHRPQVLIVDKRGVKLRSVTLTPVVIGDFGDARRDETLSIADEETFWATFLPSIQVDGVDIPLSPERLPLPEDLTDYLLARPDSPLRTLEQLEACLETASPRALLEMCAALPRP